jgi:hypothetical protein
LSLFIERIVVMRLFSNRILLVWLALLFSNRLIFADPIYLNSANPFPIFSASGRYDHLTRRARQETRKFILNNNESSDKKTDDIFHISLMPYFQTANSGTDYRGNDTLTYYNNRNDRLIPTNNAAAVTNVQANQQEETTGATLVRTVPMPIGAIPEPFNFFALFYPWDPQDPYEPVVFKSCSGEGGDVPLDTYDTSDPLPSGRTKGNLVSKIIARYLGLNDTPYVGKYSTDSSPTTDGDTGDLQKLTCSPMYWDYSNYTNKFFGVLAFPSSRDPERLFGYGYYNLDYLKFGVRSLIELKPTDDWGLRIYTGFSNLDMDGIQSQDTTMNYQGPTAAFMFQRYPDQIYEEETENPPKQVQPYLNYNFYQLTDYSQPTIGNDDPRVYNANYFDANALSVNGRGYVSNQFKTVYLQSIQNNLNSLGQILGQDFRPYHAQSFDDTTFELFYRKMVLYNSNGKIVKGLTNEYEYPPYILMPTIAAHVTMPIAPRVPGEKIFARPIDNNGHWEWGANLGCEMDFLQTVILGCDIGFSWYNASNYSKFPVPTNQYQEGVYTYSANLTKQPGYSFTLGVGMQADKFMDKMTFFGEYRIVRHNQDSFIINYIEPFLWVEYMESTHQPSNFDNIPNGVMYLDIGEPYPYPNISNVVIEHLKEISAWTVQMINLSFRFDINEDTSLGIAWQQPFAMINAYNASTFGISLEMYI